MTTASALRRASSIVFLTILSLAFLGACRREGAASALPIPTRPPLALDKPRPMPPEVEEAVSQGRTLRGAYEGAFTLSLGDSKTAHFHSFRLAEGIQVVYKQSETTPYGPGFAQTRSWSTVILNGQQVELGYGSFVLGGIYEISQYRGSCERGVAFLGVGRPVKRINGYEVQDFSDLEKYQPLAFTLIP